MTLHQLRYFVAVVTNKNFTRAAEKCLVAQPSLSQQIIQLERELGHKLLERLGRTVRPTEAGKMFHERAVAILASVDEAKRRVVEVGDPERGTLRVGAIPTVAPYLLPPLITRFLRDFPRAAFEVTEDLTEHTVRGCLDGSLDFGLVALPIGDPRLLVEPILREELLLVTPSGHRFRRKRKVCILDLIGEPFILLSEAHCLGEQIVDFCAQQSCQPLITCQSAQLLTVQELVAAGQGISLIPAMACAKDKSPERHCRSLADSKPSRTLAVIRHKDRYQSPLAARFVEALKYYARACPCPGVTDMAETTSVH
ncbi:MAG: LysR family transcriptional regulator [Candidatus Hydrogenedentes bacterium]|nr:LysR family transcriptional regulator [Candidatus Hydrogenedentota bacterium]